MNGGGWMSGMNGTDSAPNGQGYMKLVLWQKAMDLVPGIYKAVREFPAYERFGMADQIRRAAISVVANIAEGHGRESPKAFLHYLSISRGSLAELHTLVMTAERLDYLNTDECRIFSIQIVAIRRLLNALSDRLRRA